MFDEKVQRDFQDMCRETRKQLEEEDIDGPWMKEPDRKEWRHAGLPCLMSRNQDQFNWCGYVGVPPGHPMHGQAEKAQNDLDVHGGVTYTSTCHGWICHQPKPGEPDDVYWIGFDCAHAFDLIPGLLRLGIGARMKMEAEYVYRDEAYVTKEVNGLADQLARMGGKNAGHGTH